MDVRREIVRGEPIEVQGYRLVPVVRRLSGNWRQAKLGSGAVSGQGGGFVRLQPVGLTVRREGEEKYISIPDRTAQMMGGLLLAGLAVPLLLLLGVWLSRRR